MVAGGPLGDADFDEIPGPGTDVAELALAHGQVAVESSIYRPGSGER